MRRAREWCEDVFFGLIVAWIMVGWWVVSGLAEGVWHMYVKRDGPP
jgi:hypothetical protein